MGFYFPHFGCFMPCKYNNPPSKKKGNIISQNLRKSRISTKNFHSPTPKGYAEEGRKDKIYQSHDTDDK